MSMIDPLYQLYHRILANSESESEANGYLSYRAEWHAAAWGFAVGLLFVLTGKPVVLMAGVGWVFTSAGAGDAPGWLPYPKQFAKESLYVIGHAVVGVGIGSLIRLVLF